MTSPRTTQRNRHACARTIVTLQQQDGGYALLWKRYDNNKTTKETSSVYDCTVCTVAVADVFYIFNSTVVD